MHTIGSLRAMSDDELWTIANEALQDLEQRLQMWSREELIEWLAGLGYVEDNDTDSCHSYLMGLSFQSPPGDQ